MELLYDILDYYLFCFGAELCVFIVIENIYINCKTKAIAEKLELADRIDILDSKPAYISLKDHKENFRNHPTCRLINQCKSQIGLISKQILD